MAMAECLEGKGNIEMEGNRLNARFLWVSGEDVDIAGLDIFWSNLNLII